MSSDFDDVDLKNFKLEVEFPLYVTPGTDVTVQRVFSPIICFCVVWKNEKTYHDISTVKTMITVKMFFSENCFEFHKLCSVNKYLLK